MIRTGLLAVLLFCAFAILGQRNLSVPPGEGGDVPASLPPASPTATRAEEPLIPVGDAPGPTPTPMPTPEPAAPRLAVDWLVYRNEAAGYSVAYPPTWSAQERTMDNGSFATVFAPPEGGGGIEVRALMWAADGREGADLPNARCQPLTLDGLTGSRCFDTLSFTTTTTLTDGVRSYVIAITGKFVDRATYDQLLASFTTLP